MNNKKNKYFFEVERVVKLKNIKLIESEISKFEKNVLDNESIEQLKFFDKGVKIENIILDKDFESDNLEELIDYIKTQHIVGVKKISGVDLERLKLEDIKHLKDNLKNLKNIKFDITLNNVSQIIFDGVVNKYLRFMHDNVEEFANDVTTVFDQLEPQNKIFIDLRNYIKINEDDGVNVLKGIFENYESNISGVLFPEKHFLHIGNWELLTELFNELIELLKSKGIQVHPEKYPDYKKK